MLDRLVKVVSNDQAGFGRDQVDVLRWSVIGQVGHAAREDALAEKGHQGHVGVGTRPVECKNIRVPQQALHDGGTRRHRHGDEIELALCQRLTRVIFSKFKQFHLADVGPVRYDELAREFVGAAAVRTERNPHARF